MSFGRDGENNFCIACKNVKDGSNQDRISKSEILLSSLKEKHSETVDAERRRWLSSKGEVVGERWLTKQGRREKPLVIMERPLHKLILLIQGERPGIPAEEPDD